MTSVLRDFESNSSIQKIEFPKFVIKELKGYLNDMKEEARRCKYFFYLAIEQNSKGNNKERALSEIEQRFEQIIHFIRSEVIYFAKIES